jgi:hypothetical protein
LPFSQLQACARSEEKLIRQDKGDPKEEKVGEREKREGTPRQRRWSLDSGTERETRLSRLEKVRERRL